MTPQEMATIGKLCDLLITKGVQRFSGAGLEIEFAPTTPAQVVQSDVIDSEDAEKCACGHRAYEHNQGGCLMGCDASECTTEAKG